VLNDVTALSRHLRSLGIPVAPGDIRSAVTALALVPDDYRRTALGVTLVHTTAHRRALDTLADLFLAGLLRTESSGDTELGRRFEELDDERLRAGLPTALRSRDDLTLSALVAELLDRYGELDPNQPVAGTLAVRRTLRAVRPEDLRAALIAESPAADTDDPLGALRRRRREHEADQALDRLRTEVERQVWSRLARVRGGVDVARAIRTAPPDEQDLMSGTGVDDGVLDQLHRELTRALSVAAPTPSAALDPRRTLRRALATGGVPIDPVFRRRRPATPDLFVLADISGSVATFARFTLGLTARIHRRFATVRSFVFVDGVDEVSDLLSDTRDLGEVAARIDAGRHGIRQDAHSDYGRVFEEFERTQRFPATAVVLILGDARTNFRDPRAEALRRVRDRCARVWWLNPERRTGWGEGDSAMGLYAPHCDQVHECATTGQLRRALAGLR